MPPANPLPKDPIVGEILGLCESARLPERYRAIDLQPEFPRAEFRRLGEAGLLGLTTPPALGGRGLPLGRAAAALFRLAYSSGTTFAKLSLQPEFCSVLFEHGSPELVDRWFRPLLRGEILVGNQITEPTAGSDATALALEARAEGSGFVLDGTKSEAAFATDADAAIVYGRRPGSSGADGVSAFLVPQDLPGIRRTRTGTDLGERWQRRGQVDYENVQLPGDHRIGEAGAGFRYLTRELVRDRALLAAIYLGVARASWDETVAHVGQRVAFGHALAAQEAVAFPLVDDGAALEAAWLLVQAAVRRVEDGQDAAADTAMAKVVATSAALRAIDHAVQFHGGAGYSSRLPHEQRWRDVRSGSIAHGSSELLRRTAAHRLWPRRAPR